MKQGLFIDYFFGVFLKFFCSAGNGLSDFGRKGLAIDSCIDELFLGFERHLSVGFSSFFVEVSDQSFLELSSFVWFHFQKQEFGDFPVVLMNCSDKPAAKLVKPNLKVKIREFILYFVILT